MSDSIAYPVEIDDGVALIKMTSSEGVIRINPAMISALKEAFDVALGDSETRGVILTSAHGEFCVGADLTLFKTEPDPNALRALLGDLNALFRLMETQGRPVVAALTGSALGGGYELALACHHRVALNRSRLRVGLPEVLLGLIPGAGGTQRLPRMIGIQPALELITQGKTLSASRALKAGLIDALVEDESRLIETARAWVDAHPKVKQPWDKRGFKYPAGIQPLTPEARQFFMGASAFLQKKTAGAHLAPRRVIELVQECAHLSLDGAIRAESGRFIQLATQPQSRAMIRTLWFHKRALENASASSAHASGDEIEKVTLLGAGMMGAELAYLCAKAGKAVVLKDINKSSLDRGFAAIEGILAKDKKLDDEARTRLLSRITPSLDLEDVRGSDLVIEAVFEDLTLKHRVIKEIEPLLSEKGIFASNTSALPITDLAEASQHPERMIGLHFFSPASVMPLVEIIEPEATSQETRARAWHFCRAIKKTPIVVDDGYGFYTTRVFASYILEGAECVANGYAPALVEWAARSAGMAVGPLKVFDEVTLTLGMHAMEMRALYELPVTHGAGLELLKSLVAIGRKGRASGGGFFDYSHKPRRIWSGLADLCASRVEINLEEMQERLLLTQALEATRCLEEGILRCPEDGDVGAILGLGFAPNTGGPFSWMDQRGLPTIIEMAQRWVDRGVTHLTPPQRLIDMAERGARFYS